MVTEKGLTTAKILRAFARFGTLFFGIIVFVFALLSGSEEYGGGFMGIVKNSPNALPWAILLVFVFIAWKWELLGGILISALGVAMMIFYGFAGDISFSVPFLLILVLILFGLFFIISWHKRR